MATGTDTWTIVRLLKWSTQYLKEKGVDEARLHAERLLCHVLGLERVQLYLQYDRPLTQQELSAYKTVLLRRARREPLQYILGESEFYSLSLMVSPAVLIPRPETEVLVDRILQAKAAFRGPVRMLDIGTGSGAIAVAVAVHWPDVRVTALDVSQAALEVARHNARRHRVADRISLICMDILDPEGTSNLPGPFELIVSNPPYVTRDEAGSLAPEILEHEPAQALFTDEPLRYYRAILRLAEAELVPSGLLLVEVAPHRSREVAGLFRSFGYRDVRIMQDLTDRPRVVIGKKDHQHGGQGP